MAGVRRITIGGVMAVTFVLCFGFAALRNASETWAGGVFLVVCGVLACATVAAVCGPAAKRPWWFGFSLFGWGYLWLVFRGPRNAALPQLPTTSFLNAMARLLNANAVGPSVSLASPSRQFAYWQIGHCLFALLLAVVGGPSARALCTWSHGPMGEPAAVRERSVASKPRWWRRPATIAFGGSIVFVMLALVGYPRYHSLLVGAGYASACALVGTAILGAVLAGAERRAEWLGAALFGGCYLAFQLAALSPDDESRPPYIAANQLLSTVRPGFIAGVRLWHGKAFASETKDARIRQMLEQPIAMEFSHETPLEDVVRYVRAATEQPDGDAIPVYVDPVGLQEAEKTMQSPVQLHLVGVPLRVTLKLLLQQLGMTYCVRDGLLLITSEAYDGFRQEDLNDPYLLIGHAILTGLAAGLGSLLALLVAGARRNQPAVCPSSPIQSGVRPGRT